MRLYETKSTEMFNTSSGRWEEGPKLPFSFFEHLRGLPSVIDGHVTFCGGNAAVTNACFKYVGENKTWQPFPNLMEKRAHASSVMLPDNRWWVIGGNVRTTEMFNTSSGRWEEGPKLPYSFFQHCSVQLNASHSWIYRGAGGPHIYDWVAQKWTVDGAAQRRASPACILLKDGRVMVAGDMEAPTSL